MLLKLCSGYGKGVCESRSVLCCHVASSTGLEGRGEHLTRRGSGREDEASFHSVHTAGAASKSTVTPNRKVENT